MNGPITISQIPKTDTLSDTDLFLCVVGGTTKNISWGQIKALLEGKKSGAWIPTNIGSVYATNIYRAEPIYVSNFYVTNLFSTTWITNDFKPIEAPSQKAIEAIATAVPKPIFSVGQWWMISFGVLISIVCITRIAAAWRLKV